MPGFFLSMRSQAAQDLQNITNDELKRALAFDPELMDSILILHEKINRGGHQIPMALYGEGYTNGKWNGRC